MTKFYHVRSQRPRLRLILCVVLAFCIVSLFTGQFFDYHRARTPEVHQPNPTIGKVTMVYGNNSIYERALETHREHSRRQGYPLFVLRIPILDGVWNKYAILLSVLLQELEKPLDRRLQWLFWSDADTVLMNPDMPLETFLPPPEFSDVHMLLTKDWNGMNNGVFPIRVHPWAVELLSAAIAYPVVKPNVELFWPDQSALANLLEENEYFARSVVYCPLRWFNAYMRRPNGVDLNPDSPAHLQVHPGDLLVHFPGTPRDTLTQTLEPYLALAEGHRGEWDIPPERTGYIEETKRFWGSKRRLSMSK
ncbi:glycosyltransferase family 34 protein [Aspergillus clavatus NRRL 1]|uniref:Galactosyl transferase GMA12/MNN10 family protein n=1 Tax=Aspergillus clavatus (strain ATCC 1007 / CBS 513.65 / DSM 816 / NCTC 3887 / NRRL 1 / QM 1276 / 107) TaxID=344612 RepID=A1C9B8_ASPCL|nr:galactosyl transferase GMA12/MNN10 family protein [Aspergillus clavatus NRRL 1]EAW13442.1 galactosyl transferase GMA12/MNN10 family protein [Aspergillus clavatus NRRL 1]